MADTTPSNGTPATNTPETTNQTSTPQAQTQTNMSNGDLPWAKVILPTTSSGMGGIGQSKHNLQVGDWVFGIFADGDDCQQPIILGVIPGGSGASTGAGSGSGSSSGSGYSSGSGSGSSSSGFNEVGNVPSGQKIEFAYNKLKSLGFTHEQTCGIMGNIYEESKFNTSAHGDLHLAQTAYGICQWRGVRWTHLREYADGKKKSPLDYETQLEFIKYEMERYPEDTRWCWGMLQNAKTSGDAAIAFADYEFFEGCRFKGRGIPSCTKSPKMNARIKAANGFDQQFRGKAGQSPASISNTQTPSK